MEVNCQSIALSRTHQFSPLFLAYINQTDPALRDFYSYYPDIDNFDKLIRQKSFPLTSRQTLVDALHRQYSGYEDAPDFDILLQENTYTVTTGHQLNLLTGPLYVIYKIVTTIRLARELKKAYPACNFVPVYWMASEDHDFAEIASFTINGQKHTWHTDQTGAVGRMNPKELKTLLSPFPEEFDLFKEAYFNNDTLADAVRQYMHALFGREGLVTIDADDAALKGLFKGVMQDDIQQQTAVELVNETSAQLENLGYKTQIHPREINFFYLDSGIRERILPEAGGFRVNNTELHFSEEAMNELIEQHPEKLSPNVVLRPLYQEVILPNLAYVGGPSEVPYWLQLKGVFEHYGVAFPALIPRNFAVVVEPREEQKMKKMNVSAEQLFDNDVQLRREYVAEHSPHILNLSEEILAINDLFESIKGKGEAIDPTLKATVEAANVRIGKQLAQLEKRLMRAEERNYQSEIEQLYRLKNRLFPGGVPQERKENVMTFLLPYPDFIQRLFVAFQPLDFRYLVLSL